MSAGVFKFRKWFYCLMLIGAVEALALDQGKELFYKQAEGDWIRVMISPPLVLPGHLQANEHSVGLMSCHLVNGGDNPVTVRLLIDTENNESRSGYTGPIDAGEMGSAGAESFSLPDGRAFCKAWVRGRKSDLRKVRGSFHWVDISEKRMDRQFLPRLAIDME